MRTHGLISTYNAGCRCDECRAGRHRYHAHRARYGTPPATVRDMWPGEWTAQAACIGVDPDLFFPVRGGDVSAAKRVCAMCPVAAECLAYAMDTHQCYGVWGGRSERERRRMRRTVRLGVAS